MTFDIETAKDGLSKLIHKQEPAAGNIPQIPKRIHSAVPHQRIIAVCSVHGDRSEKNTPSEDEQEKGYQLELSVHDKE